ncbi:unhealthy ribosome biogenesis protein 2 homolog [Pseudophryne corroboree]|uniref:unhealthy ribosome biogenesis protein 2 homolog n=1 Tax=Pseudophryne corroboree TaxID=495146 RepID=UPI003081531D
MAAIYSGLHLKLRNSKVPWGEKIKLAHFAWVTHQCFIPNKEQVLLDWVSHALVGHHTKKINLDEDVEQKLWGFLDSVLRSKRLQSLAAEGKSVKLRIAVAQVMNDFIETSSTKEIPPAGIGTVLSCCHGVLSMPAIACVYTAKYELMVDLLRKLCTLARHCLASDQTITPQVLSVLHTSLIQYLQVQRQQGNPNRVFTHVLAQLFQPCLVLKNALGIHVFGKNNNRECYNLVKDIERNLESVLHSAFFHDDLLSFYKEELLPELDKSEKKKGSLRGLLSPASCITAKLGDVTFCDADTHLAVVADSLPLLYKLFLDSYCKDGKELVCFHMLVKLFTCIRSSVAVKRKGPKAPSSGWTMGLSSLEQLLNLVLSHNIYNVAVDHIRHRDVQFQFYRTLAETLVGRPCTSSASWFRCLKNLNLLNHLIVEPDLEDLLSHAWIGVDLSDAPTSKAQEALISSLLQTYTKLRQFPKLFKDILMVICRMGADELREPPFVSSTVNLTECLVQLPHNQILDIWDMVLERCHGFILPDIKGNPDLCLKLFSVSSILHFLMFNMKTLDNNTPVPVLKRFQNLMKQMADELICPSLELLKDVNAGPTWLQKLCDAALLLLYTWIEVDTVTTLNCSKYVSQLRPSLPSDSKMKGWDFSLFFEDKECWRKIYGLCTVSNPVSMFCLQLLSVQKLKHVLMQAYSPNEYDQLTVQAAASLVVHSGSCLTVPKHQEPWSGNACAVNVACFPVARWHLIASNLLLLLPYLPQDDINHITDFLLDTVVSAQDAPDRIYDDSSVTLEDVSVSLLHSDLFAEMPLLQCAFINSIIKKCALLLREQAAVREILHLLSAKDIHWHEDSVSAYNKATISSNPKISSSGPEYSPCMQNLQNAGLRISSMTAAQVTVNLSESDLNDIIGVIECISALQPDSLTPTDQCRCLLALLSLASTSGLLNLRLAHVCYSLMTRLLSGKHANSVFKLLYASDVVTIVMTGIQSAKWRLADDEKERCWAEFVYVMQSFFEAFLMLVFERKQSLVLNLEKLATFLVNALPNADSKDWTSRVGQLFIVALNSLCNHLAAYIQKQKGDRQRTEVLSSLLQQVVVKMNAVVRQCVKASEPCQVLPSFLVSCTTTLLEAELSCHSRDGLQNAELYRSFCSQILRELCYAKKQDAFLKSALRYLKMCIGVKEIHTAQETVVIAVFVALKKLLASARTDSEFVQSAEVQINDLFTQMAENCSCEEFCTIMKATLYGLEVSNLWKNNYKELFASITLTKLLLNCPLTEDKRKLFWCTASQITTALVTLCTEVCKDRSLLTSIAVPVLDTIALLLRRGEMDLLNPHHVTLSFSPVLTVPLDHLKAEEYYSVFLAIHEVLFSCLQCHPKVMLKAVATFLNIFHRLVSSVMHEGRQKGEKGAANESETILKCAQLVERMYTHIAAKTEEFTVFSTSIVSQYVHELQKVTLQPAVKKHLTQGIFHIMDLCIDRDIKFLNASLQMEVREVFKELYHEYTSQHKARDRGEEKYTA